VDLQETIQPDRPPPSSPHATARRLRRHRPTRAVRLAALVVGAAVLVRVAGADFAVTRFRTSPSGSAPVSVTASARAVGSLSTPRFTPSALVLPMTTPIVAVPTSSVHLSSTPCLASTSRQRIGSSPSATSPARAVRLAALPVGSFHVPVVGAGFASPSLPVTPFMFTTLPTTAAMSCTVP